MPSSASSGGDQEEGCSHYLTAEGERTLLKSSDQASSSSSALSFEAYNLRDCSRSWHNTG